jgi:predicted dehydrogenase
MIDAALVGYGHWGTNLARNLQELDEFKLATIVEIDPARRAAAKARYPGTEVTASLSEALSGGKNGAVLIATPPATHFELALTALRAGRHVVVEKPLAETAEQVLRLHEEAEKRQLSLMVDHTYVYSTAAEKLSELISRRHLGDVLYYDSTRINLGLFQRDVNVLWDLAVHDFSLIAYLLEESCSSVSATGLRHYADQHENIAFVTLFFASPVIAHVHVNWTAPHKVRRVYIGGTERMAVYDELNPSERIKIYDVGVEIGHRDLVGYRTGDCWSPKVREQESLKAMLEHFHDSISHKTRPITDTGHGLQVMRLLEAATISLKASGAPVEVIKD